MTSPERRPSLFVRILRALENESWRQDDPPRRHHIVPKVYLRHFAKPRHTPTPKPSTKKKKRPAYMTVYDLTHDTPRSGGLRELDSVAVETDFYQLPATDPRDRPIVEHLLGHIETPSSQVLERLANPGTFPDAEEREILTAFVAMQFSRGYRVKDGLSRSATKMAQIIGDIAISDREAARAMLRESNQDSSDQAVTELQDSFRKFPPQMIPNQPLFLRSILESFYNACIFIHGRNWTIMESRSPYLTSDEPVVMHPDTHTDNLGHQSIAGSPVISMPLSRFRCLTMFRPDRPKMPEIVPAPPATTPIVNHLTAAQARRFVMHHPDDSSNLGIDIGSFDRRGWTSPRVTRGAKPDPDEGSD